MHYLQKHILSRLVFQPECRYRDLKPEGVDGNLFSYHLKELIREELIQKEGSSYLLTTAGIRYVSALSLANYQPRIQPKIVTLVACENYHHEWLLYQSKRQPFFGLSGFPYGKIHLGETVMEAAQRELKEKTGISANLWHRGEVYLTVYEGKELVMHMLCHVFYGKDPSGELIEQSSMGRCYWKNLERFDHKQFFPGFADIFKLLQQDGNDRFFAEFTYRLTD